jgi:hypothetical protein
MGRDHRESRAFPASAGYLNSTWDDNELAEMCGNYLQLVCAPEVPPKQASNLVTRSVAVI